MGAQMLAETYGLRPFHVGGGGGGGSGCSAATQVFDAGSYTVPWPHSVALLTPGDSVTNASDTTTTTEIRTRPIITGSSLKVLPDPAQSKFYDRLGTNFTRFDDRVNYGASAAGAISVPT